MRTREEEEFDACFDERGMLRDGITHIRVPVKLMDSDYTIHHFGGRAPLRIDTAAWDAAIKAANARVRHQPGPITRDARTRDAVNDYYNLYDAVISEQYKNPPTGVGSHGFAGARVGDLCTVRRGGGKFGPEGSDGTLQMVDGQLECVADGFEPDEPAPRPKDSRDANAIKDAAYARYDAELADAWRRAK